MADLAEYKLSPALAVALDLWGQTVAHRAATIVAPRWFILPPDQGKKRLTASKHRKVRANRADLTASRNHAGLQITGYQLAQNWARIVKLERSFPAKPDLSPATRKLLLEMTGHGSGSKGKPGDMRAIMAAYLSITTMLLGRNRWAGATRDMRSLIAWLFAVPFFTGAETDVAAWCTMRYAGAGLKLADLIAARDADVRRWIAKANQQMRSQGPDMGWLVGDEWANACDLDRLAAGAAPESMAALMSYQREYLSLLLGLCLLLRSWPQDEEEPLGKDQAL